MSADWQVGDLALCVDASAWPGSAGIATEHLREGVSYRVIAVTEAVTWVGGRVDSGLVLVGVPNPLSSKSQWPQSRFRKIRHDEHESCEPDFVTLLKRSKPKVRA